jgi:transcriptional regulator with XRE-family HTH domain
MDVSALIRARLDELGFEQKDLAAAADVTESYVSQLLSRKKLPPAPDRTEIYEKMGRFLRLSHDELAKLARAQRREKLGRGLEEAPAPLLKDVRDLILGKCAPGRQQEIRAIFERQPFGELERFVTRTLLDVISRVARAELDNPAWIRDLAGLSERRPAKMRAIILEFLEADIFNVSSENFVAFLSPLIAYWDINLSTFDMEIALNDRLVAGQPRKLAFVEKEPDGPLDVEPGLTAFLEDATLSANLTRDELQFLKSLRFKGKRPNALYYYRELQNLRDPLHFQSPS